MIFRFTLSYSIETIIEAADVEELPPLSEWLSRTEVSRVPWTLGASPSVALNNEVSEILYVDYDFMDGIQYMISCSFTKTVTGSDSPPRFLSLSVLNDAFSNQFTTNAPGFNANGNLTDTFELTFTATANCKKVGIQTQYGGQATIQITTVTLGLDQPEDTVVVNADSLVISEPEGWEDAVLKLERDENFHSVIEYFEGEFIFYGDNGVENGGIDFIKFVESTFGPDADLNILIEISFDGYEYEEVFRGLLDLSTIIEMEDNMLQCSIVRNDFWTKFITRQETQVDLQANESVDGEGVQVHDSVNLSMLSQILVQKFYGYFPDGYITFDDLSNDFLNTYVAYDVTFNELDEVEEKYNLPILQNTEKPVWIFEPRYDGEYLFDIRWEASHYFAVTGGADNLFSSVDGDYRMKVYIQKNEETAIEFSKTDHSYNNGIGTYESTVYYYQGFMDLVVSDVIRIYAFIDIAFSAARVLLTWGQDTSNIVPLSGPAVSSIAPSQAETPSYIRVTAETIFPVTNSEGFLIHDAAAHICDRIISRDNTFYSEFLGSTLTQAAQYEADGCGWFYMVLKGLQVRQYSLLEKPFFMSFKQWWEGANPILNLGLGYETIDSITESLLLNDSFDTSSAWTNEGTGATWAVGSGSAVVNLFTTDSKELTQVITGTVAGQYVMTGNYNMTGIVFGSFRARLRIVVVDDQGTETTIESLSPITDVTPSQGHPDFDATFNSSYPVVSIYAIAEIIQGTAHTFTITLNHLTLSGPVGGDEVIRVEEKKHFYQNEIAVYFSNVRMRRMYDHEYFFNNVDIGYKKWQSEDVSGIDDPQTKHTYTTRFKKLGKKITLHSDWIGAGLTIEKTRRTTREKSADYKYDNDAFIVAINPVPVDISPETSPDVIDYEPELTENFTSVSNLLNSDTRYNLRLTPARNLLRWLDFLSGCLQNYVTSFFKFSSGEGNYDMRSTMIDSSPDCDDPSDYAGDQLSEKGNVQVGSEYLFIPVPIECTVAMEWEDYKLINRKKAIGISQTDVNHAAFFIKSIEYKIAQGVADMVLWPKDLFALAIVVDVPETQVCVPTAEEEQCAILAESGETIPLETGSGIMILESCT